MIEQNTPEWEEMRKNKIGASDAPVIMGVSPYSTPYQLWQKKLSLTKQHENWAMRQGHEQEPIARQKLEEMTQMLFTPMVKFHPKVSWMMASLDAMEISGEMIAEIKWTNSEDHALAKSGKIPDKHFPQLQHQMEVCEKEKAIYFSFHNGEGIIVLVPRDDRYIKAMMSKEEEFVECVSNLTPPALTNRDYREIEDDRWVQLANKWQRISSQLSDLEQEEELLRKELISLADNQNTAGGGIRVSKLVRKGNVDYSKIPELKGIDTELYRKPPSEYWKIITK